MTPVRRRSVLASTLVALITLAAPAGALGADWLTPSTISRVVPQYVGDQPVTLASPDGTATTLWVDSSLDPAAADLRMVRVTPDGARSAVQDLTALPSAINGDPAAAAGTDGRISIAWERDQRIEVLRLAPDGTALGAPAFVSPAGVQAAGPAITVSDDGATLVTWVSYDPDPTGTRVLMRSIDPTGVMSAAPIEVTDPDEEGSPGEPALAATASGQAVVAWSSLDEVLPGSYYRARVARIDADGVVAGPETLYLTPVPADDETDVYRPRVSAAPDGRAWVMAVASPGVLVWRLPAGPGLTPDTQTGPVGVVAGGSVPQGGYHRISALSDGGALATWEFDPSGPVERVARVMRIGASGAAGTVQEVDPGFDYTEQTVAAPTSGGAAMLVWNRNVGLDGFIVARSIDAGGALGPRAVVSGASAPGYAAFPAVASWPSGDVAAAWFFQAPAPDADRSIRHAHFDATALVVALNAPDGATVGEPADFGAAVSDRVDAEPLVYSWEFGDGSVSAEAAPTHVFTQPGARTVRLTVTDAAGNASTAQSVVLVTPAPVGQAPGPPPPTPDTTAPRLTSLSVTPARVTRGTLARTTRLTRIRFRLDEAARARIAVERQLPGRRLGARCVVPTRALIARRARPCVRFVNVGLLARDARAGLNTVTLARLRVGRRTLAPGRRRIRVQATDAAGNRSLVRTRPLLVLRAPAGT